MTVEMILERLRALGNPTVYQRNLTHGAGDQFGVKLGDIRIIAKAIKTDDELAKTLWQTGNADAMLLATLLMRPAQLSSDDLEQMVIAAKFLPLADWLGANVVKLHPKKEVLRQRWMESSDHMTLRAAWMLTAERVAKSPDGLDVTALLSRIEAQMGQAAAPVQWTMNNCLAGIGIHMADHRERAITIGERLGVFRDYPTPKGCTSPFAPSWIQAIVARG